jgi:hypothetical protein
VSMTAPTEERITELDVLDPEVEEMRVWVRCEECDDGGEAVDMVRQHDGAWLCAGCDAGARAEYDDWLRTARGW